MKRLMLTAAVFAATITAAHAVPVRVDIGAGHGSGFTIGDRYVVTAAHVIIGAGQIEDDGALLLVVTEDGKKFAAEVVWANHQYDVAVIRVSDPSYTEPEASKYDCAAAPVGTEVEMVGNPFDAGFVHTWGRIAADIAKRAFWEAAYIVNITGGPGVSGAPVSRVSDGAIVGIATGGISHTGYAYVVPMSVACKLIDGNKLS